jgi:transcriptional regulator GlxA family with amidase domain
MMNVGIYIYDQAEVLDFSGPFEVFSTAARISQSPEPFTVFLVSETGQTVTGRAGFSVNPSFGFHNHPQIDVLLIVGGVHTEEMKKPAVMSWIAKKALKAKLVASVCTGAFLLAEAGVLSNQNVTTHWEDISDLQQNYPSLHVHADKMWIDEGKIVTSAGISAGIHMSLHLISKLHSDELATQTAKQMEFHWIKSA